MILMFFFISSSLIEYFKNEFVAFHKKKKLNKIPFWDKQQISSLATFQKCMKKLHKVFSVKD